MTAPVRAAAPVATPPWYARPTVMVPLLLGIAIASALLTPERANTFLGDARLTTRETTPLAASLAADLPRRLGWRVGENTRAEVPSRTEMVHVLLAPSEPLRATEVHALLERVRAGAGLYVIASSADELMTDSLHVASGPAGMLADFGAAGLPCPAKATQLPPWLLRSARFSTVRWTAPPPGALDTLLRTVSPDSATRRRDSTVADDGPVLLGFGYGRGRVVIGMDADLVRNDAMRQCAHGLSVAWVRALEYLRDRDAGIRRTWLLFDEYHQGHGVQPGTVRAVVVFFSDTSEGHVLAQLAIAGLLFLVMRMPRLVPPAPEGAIERRSPIEHVDALARAYVQVGATKTATQRLVRGLRRRLDRGPIRGVISLSDDAFLERTAARVPGLGAPVRTLRKALANGHAARDFAAVGDALATIEHSLRKDS